MEPAPDRDEKPPTPVSGSGSTPPDETPSKATSNFDIPDAITHERS